jgi:transposase
MGVRIMMGQSTVQDQLFYAFNLEGHVPRDHLLRGVDRFLDLSELRQHLAPLYSHTGRPSIDPELMIRMLVIGYCLGIRSERRLCEEVHLDLAYRWFCRLGLEDRVPDHSTFSKNRHGRFRQSDAFRFVFETVLHRCMTEGLVQGEGFAIDAIIIMDLEATPAHRTPEVDSTRTMIDRVEDRFDIKPKRLVGDTAYGTAPLLGWMVEDKRIEPHVPVWDKTTRKDGSLSIGEFQWVPERNEYICPEGHSLRKERRRFTIPRSHVTKADTVIDRASQTDCVGCSMKDRCCPNTPFRKIARSIHEGAREMARSIAKTPEYSQSRRDRKKVEMLFAHLKRIMKLDRLRLCGLSGAQDEFLLAATAQNLRRMAKWLMPIEGHATVKSA